MARGTLLIALPFLCATASAVDLVSHSGFEDATCGDGIAAELEQCDDGDADDFDGCTSACRIAVACDATNVPGGDRFAVDPATGHCYAAFDDERTSFDDARLACGVRGGDLATVASADEHGRVRALQAFGQNPWIGGYDDANDTDAVFT